MHAKGPPKTLEAAEQGLYIHTVLGAKRPAAETLQTDPVSVPISQPQPLKCLVTVPAGAISFKLDTNNSKQNTATLKKEQRNKQHIPW